MNHKQRAEFERRILNPFPPAIVALALPKHAHVESFFAPMRRIARIALGPRHPDNRVTLR